MNIANTFPVFEPDQVLTNKHLNDMFNYLDEQDRLTRCMLLGSGIVCGLEISHTASSIGITKGCGLTTQGYIVLFCDHTGNDSYKYYMPFSRPSFPKDLQLITQCGPDPDITKVLFYAPPASLNNVTDEYLLLTQKDVDALSDKTGVNPITKLALKDYAVVLFLDVTETSLKNCDTNDCNDKGSVMDFEIKPLLVNKSELQGGNTGGKSTFQPINLRRYNVPVQNLTSSEDVLKAFVTVVEALPLKTLAADLANSFNGYKALLNGVNTNPFGSEADFENMLLEIMKNYPYLVQYYYDFIYDLVKALYEFRHRLHNMTTACCGDEMAFPFHLTLGEADVDTAVNGISDYRQYFIYSPLFDTQNGNRDEIRSLLMRMVLMYQDCFFTQKTIGKKSNLTLPDSIKITPSTYGRNFISDRCIPYYYSPVADKSDAISGNLYYYWNYDKTKRGNAKYNLSYNAEAYNKADQVVYPLVYDIEWYDFFRIEGHINQNINTVVSEVKARQQNFNLPFDIVALSADYIGVLLNGGDPKCCIQDLESDYRVIIAEFICTIHDALCDTAGRRYVATHSGLPPGSFPLTGAAFDREAAVTAKDEANTISSERLSSGRANIAADHPFISNLVNEFQTTGSYVKGTTLDRLCSPDDGSMGRYYIDSIKKNWGNFVNPYSNKDTPYFHLMQFIDKAEIVFALLMDNDLDALDVTEFKFANINFEIEGITFFDSLYDQLKTQPDSAENRADIFQIQSYKQVILHTCITEKLNALKSEYLRRVAQFRLAKNFNQYFKKHGGIEHKSGVPRGGTFILVYHEERRNRFVDVNSLYLNKEMGKLLLSGFRELLNPDADLDALEAKAKMVAVSTLYKDPALYLQYKDVMMQYLDGCKDLPDDKRTAITGILNQPPAGQTSFELTDGTVIADFYVPYLCCSDCPPIAYILPPAPPVVTPLNVIQSAPVCDSTNKNFTVTLTVTGGTAPYTYTKNGAALASNQVTLTSGSADTLIVVTDSKGQTVTVTIKGHTCEAPPPPLTVTQGDAFCNDKQTEFTVVLTVIGGTAPYTYSVSGKTLPDNKVTLPSGSPDTPVIITDAAGKTITIMVKGHTCEGQGQCNLPCDGLAENCKYAIWMPRPIEAKDFIKHTIGKAVLTLTDENGTVTTIDVMTAFKEALDRISPITTNAAFDDGFFDLAKRLSKPVPANFTGGGAPMFTYSPDSQTIAIEKFKCQKVVLEFDGTVSSQQLDFDYHIVYDTDKATMKLGSIEPTLKVPKFGCLDLDKCNGTRSELCNSKLEIKSIKAEQLPAGGFMFSVVPDVYDTYFWYFHDGKPMYTNEKNPKLAFAAELKQTFVRVVAIRSKDGCFAVMEQFVKIG